MNALADEIIARGSRIHTRDTRIRIAITKSRTNA